MVLGALGDSQFLVRGYRKVYVDTFLCICVFLRIGLRVGALLI